MLRQRLLSAAVLIPVVFVSVWFGDPWFTVLIAAVAVLAAVEFYGMAAGARWQTLSLLGALWSLFFVLNAHSQSPDTLPMLITSAIVLSLLLFVFLRPQAERAFGGWAYLLAGMFYSGWLLSYWILLGGYGREWVLLALFSTFATDTSAYFAGRTWGRRKMAPSISPGKTWEGAAGGMAGALAAAVLLAVILGLNDIGYVRILLLGFLISIFAQVGDLAESRIKRSTGVKDAGKFIPGHGGILDRLDSVVFTGIVVYYYLRWVF